MLNGRRVRRGGGAREIEKTKTQPSRDLKLRSSVAVFIPMVKENPLYYVERSLREVT